MALDYFDIGGRIGVETGKSEPKRKKTSKRGGGPDPSSFKGSGGKAPAKQPTPQSPSANTGGGDAAKADAERKAREAERKAREAEQNRLGAEAARKYATSGTETNRPDAWQTRERTNNQAVLPNAPQSKRKPGEQVYLNGMWAGVGAQTGIASTKENMEEEQRRRTRRGSEMSAELEERRKGDFDNKFKEMTWEDYEKLSKRQKAAIDWNSTMAGAYQRDRKLAKKLGGADKRLTLDEIGSEKRDAYRRSYQRIFGQGAEDNEIDYSPRVVAMLDKVLGTGTNLGSAKEVLNGGAFITDTDMTNGNIDRVKENPQLKGVGSMTSSTGSRRSWVSQLVDYQKQMTDGLSKAKAIVNGVGEKIQINDLGSDRLDQMVEQAAAGTQADPDNWGLVGMLKSGAINRSGINLSNLLTPGQARRNEELVQAYNEVGQQLQAQNWSLDYLQNEGFMRGVAKQRGLDENRWLELSRNMKKAGEKDSQTALDKVLYGEKES